MATSTEPAAATSHSHGGTGSATDEFTPEQHAAIADRVQNRERRIAEVCTQIAETGSYHIPGFRNAPANQRLWMTPGKLPADIATCVRPLVRQQVETEDRIQERLNAVDETLGTLTQQMDAMHAMLQKLLGAQGVPWPPADDGDDSGSEEL